jgi:hypothetical protein
VQQRKEQKTAAAEPETRLRLRRADAVVGEAEQAQPAILEILRACWGRARAKRATRGT